ncbi:MAG TPA: hypothetical protein ENJ45_02105, partial [Phaeodactylibacter sp.]|nr:hypothetical protein [Phaeodactylibacter sp.]
EWNAFKNNSTQITKPLLTIVSYSSLLDNPFYELKKILDSLHLNCISNEHIQQSIEEESFQAMKNRQNNNTPDYEKALLRTAQKEDWKNYFTNYNLKQLQTASTVEDLARAEQKYIV